MTSRRATLVVLAVLAGLAPGPAVAAELQPRTSQAYDLYLNTVQRAFLARVQVDTAAASGRDGVLSAGPGREDGIVAVPGGLVHHWIGTAFVRGVTLQTVVDVSKAYSTYSRVYKAVVDSRLIAQEDDTYRVLLRLKEGEAGVSAVLQIRSTVQYGAPSRRTVYAISNADDIREVKNAGAQDERLLPAGLDSGSLWRANTFTWFIEREDGVYVEMETLGLSRGFPPLLGWIIEPIARRMGRKSVERSLEEFLAAVRAGSSTR